MSLEEKRPIPKVPAFKDTLTHSEFDKFNIPGHPFHSLNKNRLFELQNSGRFIVRTALPGMLDELETGNIADKEQGAQIVRALFEELVTKYNVVAPVHFVVAEDESTGEKVRELFVLTERIQKTDLAAVSQDIRDQVSREYIDIFKSLTRYLADKTAAKGAFLNDICDRNQFVYGKREGDHTSRWYLIDTDPFFAKGAEAMRETSESLADILKALEKENQISLREERDVVRKIRRTISRRLRQEPVEEVHP